MNPPEPIWICTEMEQSGRIMSSTPPHDPELSLSAMKAEVVRIREWR